MAARLLDANEYVDLSQVNSPFSTEVEYRWILPAEAGVDFVGLMQG